MKYSKNFIRDFNWLLSVRHEFSFSGSCDREIVFDCKGLDGKKAFHIYDSTGKLRPTRHPNMVRTLLRTKASVNLHIKMYAEGRADGTFPKFEFLQMCEKIKAPDWFFEAVERQKIKNINNSNFPEWFKRQAENGGVNKILI